MIVGVVSGADYFPAAIFYPRLPCLAGLNVVTHRFVDGIADTKN